MREVQNITVERTTRQHSATLAMLAACTAVFLTALDLTVVVTALPQIKTDLQIPDTQLDRAAWIVSGYLLGYVIVMPLMGRISDLYGRRRVFVLCLSVFALGSLGCALAPNLGNTYDISFLQNIGIDTSSPGLIWLVAARFLQAVGGGAVVPVAMAIAGDFYGYEKRGIALGLIGMVTEAGGALGPLYGALIVQNYGWQAIFYINLPLVALLLILLFLFVPGKSAQDKVREGISTSTGSAQGTTPTQRRNRRIDIIGAVLLGASLVCLSLGLAQEAGQITSTTMIVQGSSAQNNLWLLAASLLLLASFIGWEIFVERRSAAPIIAPSLFHTWRFSSTALMSFVVGVVLIIAMVGIPLYFITVFNQSDIDSGLALLRLTIMIPIGAIIGGWLCGRITCRWTAVPGLLITFLGFWFMHLWSFSVDWSLITVSTLIAGFGLGLVIAPISTTAINSATPHQLGMASSIVTVLRMIGMILGLAFLTSWGLARIRTLMAGFKPPAGVTALSPKYAQAYLHYFTISAQNIFSTIFLVAGIFCLLALLPALGLQGQKTSDVPIRTNNEDAPITSHIQIAPDTQIERGASHKESKVR
jgi:MFS family permease